MSVATEAPRPKAVLVGVQLPGVTDAEQRSSLKELERLCKTLGFAVVGEVAQKRKSLGAATLLGAGKLAELAACMELWPQVLVNVPVARRRELTEIPGYVKQLKQAEAQLGGNGRILVRFSGTEPLVRVMVEGEPRQLVEQTANSIADAVRRAAAG